jgi:hypothetical protein
MTKLKSAKGFSLIELMLASATSFLVILSIAAIMISASGFRNDIENAITGVRNNQDLARDLAKLNFCSPNLRDISVTYNLNDPTFLANGIDLTLKAVDSSNQLTQEVVAGPGMKLGNLPIKTLKLRHIRSIDKTHDLAEVAIDYDTQTGNSTSISIIVERSPSYPDRVDQCYGGNLLGNLNAATGQDTCDLMREMFGGVPMYYDPVSNLCVPETVDKIWVVGSKYTVACPSDHPYTTGNYWECSVANYDYSGCPTCSYTLGGSTTNMSGFRCYLEKVGGVDGARCEYALGTTGNCGVYCVDKRFN